MIFIDACINELNTWAETRIWFDKYFLPPQYKIFIKKSDNVHCEWNKHHLKAIGGTKEQLLERISFILSKYSIERFFFDDGEIYFYDNFKKCWITYRSLPNQITLPKVTSLHIQPSYGNNSFRINLGNKEFVFSLDKNGELCLNKIGETPKKIKLEEKNKIWNSIKNIFSKKIISFKKKKESFIK